MKFFNWAKEANFFHHEKTFNQQNLALVRLSISCGMKYRSRISRSGANKICPDNQKFCKATCWKASRYAILPAHYFGSQRKAGKAFLFFLHSSEDKIDLYYLHIILASTARNTEISPNFMVWKFCGNALLPQNFKRNA